MEGGLLKGGFSNTESHGALDLFSLNNFAGPELANESNLLVWLVRQLVCRIEDSRSLRLRGGHGGQNAHRNKLMRGNQLSCLVRDEYLFWAGCP